MQGFKEAISSFAKGILVFFIVCFALVLLLLAFYLVPYFFQETIPNHKRTEKSKVMAIESAKEKYGIDIEIRGVSLGSSTGGMEGFTWDSTASVNAFYKDEEISFRVLPDRDFIADDYQAEEIDQALQEFLPQYLDIPEPLGLVMSYGYQLSGKHGKIYFDTYYDGTNIEEVYKATSPTTVVAYPDNVEIPENVKEKMYSLAEGRESSSPNISLLFFDHNRLDEIIPLGMYLSMQEAYAPYITHKMQTELTHFYEDDNLLFKIEQTENFYSLDIVQATNLSQPNFITRVLDQDELQDPPIVETEPPLKWDLCYYEEAPYELLTPTYAKDALDTKSNIINEPLYLSIEDLQNWKDQGYTSVRLLTYEWTSDEGWYVNWTSGNLMFFENPNNNYGKVIGEYYYVDLDYPYSEASYITFVGAKEQPEIVNSSLTFSDELITNVVYFNPLNSFTRRKNFFLNFIGYENNTYT